MAFPKGLFDPHFPPPVGKGRFWGFRDRLFTIRPLLRSRLGLPAIKMGKMSTLKGAVWAQNQISSGFMDLIVASVGGSGRISHGRPRLETNTLRYPVLYGEHELSIDEKNRLLIPADVRKCLKPDEDGSAFFIKVGSNRVPWLYPEKYYEYLGTQAPPVITPDRDALAHAQLHFALASRLEWDKQGRVLVPERILKQSSIGKDVVLIGCRDHLQLWNREAWERRRDELLNAQV